jgi:hypothetical protein
MKIRKNFMRILVSETKIKRFEYTWMNSQEKNTGTKIKKSQTYRDEKWYLRKKKSNALWMYC